MHRAHIFVALGYVHVAGDSLRSRPRPKLLLLRQAHSRLGSLFALLQQPDLQPPRPPQLRASRHLLCCEPPSFTLKLLPHGLLEGRRGHLLRGNPKADSQRRLRPLRSFRERNSGCFFNWKRHPLAGGRRRPLPAVCLSSRSLLLPLRRERVAMLEQLRFLAEESSWRRVVRVRL